MKFKFRIFGSVEELLTVERLPSKLLVISFNLVQVVMDEWEEDCLLRQFFNVENLIDHVQEYAESKGFKVNKSCHY